jgi:twitching motility protein PilT
MNLAQLVTWANKEHASDIHVLPNGSLWLRCSGELKLFSEHQFDITLLQSLLTDTQHDYFSQHQQIDLGYQIDHQRMRIHLFIRDGGLGAVLRLIPTRIPSLSQLPAPAICSKWLEETQGLLLITGPTGSGKSTTLAAMVSTINTHSAKHVITLEDPIEFIHHSQKSLITQREYQTHFHDYPSALKSALREDPDVILIGELRDLETMQMALSAAETGHLVLATLHTGTAAASIDRFIDVFPENKQTIVRALLANHLIGVLSQQLIGTTPHARHALFEVLCATPAVRQLIRDNNVSQLITAMQSGATYGMQTFEQARGFID